MSGEAVGVMRERSVEHLHRFSADFEHWIMLEEVLRNKDWPNEELKEEVIQRYFDDLRNNGSGGLAIAAAISDMLGESIRIFDNQKELVKFSGAVESKEICILLNGADHFDCIVDLIELSEDFEFLNCTSADPKSLINSTEENDHAIRSDSMNQCQESDIMEMSFQQGDKLGEESEETLKGLDTNETWRENHEAETEPDFYCVTVNKKHYLKMLRVPADGSCLYHSLVHQLKRFGIRYTAQGLRKDSADYLEQNWIRYENDILSEATSRNLCWPSDEMKPEVIMRHIKSLREPNTWAGSEVNAAVADMLDIAIRVFNVRIEPLVFGASPDRQNRTVDIFYTGAHYDSVVEIHWNKLDPSGRTDKNRARDTILEKEAALAGGTGYVNYGRLNGFDL